MNEADVYYAAEAGLLPPYDAQNNPVKLETHRDSDLAGLLAWFENGPSVEGWALWCAAGFGPDEARRMWALPEGDETRPTETTLRVLAALRATVQPSY